MAHCVCARLIFWRELGLGIKIGGSAVFLNQLEMEELGSVYSELATAKMKYDHLFNVCTSLLKSW
jgi:hypothetical protein